MELGTPRTLEKRKDRSGSSEEIGMKNQAKRTTLSLLIMGLGYINEFDRTH